MKNIFKKFMKDDSKKLKTESPKFNEEEIIRCGDQYFYLRDVDLWRDHYFGEERPYWSYRDIKTREGGQWML